MTDRLARGQRELARLLRAPEGVAETLALAGDPEGRSLAGRVRGDASADAILRLEIYANAIFQRMREVLEEEFEALARTLGADAFHDLVTAYLLVHPSRHPSLRVAGEALPEFLAAHEVAAPFRERWPWAPDLARLEWALSLAFDAADAPTLARADLGRVALDDWEGLVLGFQPSVRLLRVAWPVQRLVASASDTSLDAPEPTALVVWRRDERPRQRVAPPLEADLIERALAGATFGALCAHAADAVGAESAAPRVAELLAGWTDAGLLTA